MKYVRANSDGMPVITIQSSPLSVEKKREASRILTDEFSRISGIPADKIIVILNYRHDLLLHAGNL